MIGWLITLGYVAIGVATYVKILPENYRRSRAANEKEFITEEFIEKWARRGAMISAGWKSVVWIYPWFIETPLRKLNEYSLRPVVEERERLTRLKQDRDDWFLKSRNSADPEERRMASDIVKALDETLKGN